MNDPDQREHAILLALSEVRRVCKPHELAQIVEQLSGSLADAIEGVGLDEQDGALMAGLVASLDRTRIDHWAVQLRLLEQDGIRLVTCVDEEYPVNLRMIFNRPPFLFYRGEIRDSDQRAVAVVGTRSPSDEGRRIATKVATELVEHDVTVVSGLALGVDVAAHAASLNAGGRTIAVLGSSLDHVSPAANRSVANRIASNGQGALVSQFLPGTPPRRWTFPQRNVVTSGLSAATVVVEAGPTSGARLQAENCLEHGKKLLLVKHLVTSQPWAAEMTDRAGVSVVDSVDEIVSLAAAEALAPAEIC